MATIEMIQKSLNRKISVLFSIDYRAGWESLNARYQKGKNENGNVFVSAMQLRFLATLYKVQKNTSLLTNSYCKALTKIVVLFFFSSFRDNSKDP